MTALIIANGEVGENICDILPHYEFVICADGGVRHLEKLGISADIVLGDMDSAGEISLGDNVITYPVRKDFTDGEIAVNYALENGYTDIVMIGFTGTRLDHTLTNIFLLEKIAKHGGKGKIIDDNNIIMWAERENIIEGSPGEIISIIPVGGDVFGVTTQGLDYPLKDEKLEFGKSRGVSNVMTGEKCRICIKKGQALIIKSKD